MNTPMDPIDDDLRALLAEDSELLQRYRALPQSEPGKHLDAAILGRAHNAVRRPALRQRWLVPLASAASVVVAAGIGWRVHQSQLDDAAKGTQAARKYDVLEIDLQSGDRRRALETAAMPPEPAAQAPAGADAEKKSERQTLSEIIAAPNRDQGIVVEPHTRADHAQGGRAPEQRESMPSVSSAPFAKQAPAAAAPPPPPAPASRAQGEAEADEADTLNRVTVTGSRVRGDRANEARKSGSFADSSSDGYGNELLSPADWIERIRALVSSRRLAQAREEIARFRDAYPSYRLPPDLRRYER